MIVSGKKNIFLLVAWGVIFFTVLGQGSFNLRFLSAQEKVVLSELTKEAFDANPSAALYSVFEELTSKYFSAKKYSECVKYLASVAKSKKEFEPVVNYYIALARYNQLKYLEEAQDWNEYFNSGSGYREEFLSSVKKAIEATDGKNPIHIKSRLILWRFFKDQDDPQVKDSLDKLNDAVLKYSKDTNDFALIKEVADDFRASGINASSKTLYKIYVNKISSTYSKDEDLYSAANEFYKEGNIDLSEALYDVFIRRAAQTLAEEKLLQILVQIAKQFSYQSEKGKDLFYAETVFSKIQSLGGIDVFDEELLYTRAMNLEKSKCYSEAKDLYSQLNSRFVSGKYSAAALYKVGLISVYVNRQILSGKGCFEKLAVKEEINFYTIGALYQLGLLTHWEGRVENAKVYFSELINKAKENFADEVSLAHARLAEIEQSKPMEYNLKAFLDISLKDENKIFNMSKADVKVSNYMVEKGKTMEVRAEAFIGETGCMQVDLKYLWSGQLGAKDVSSEKSSFEAVYSNSGVKQINLLVVSSSGIVDRSINFVDVY